MAKWQVTRDGTRVSPVCRSWPAGLDNLHAILATDDPEADISAIWRLAEQREPFEWIINAHIYRLERTDA